MFLSSGRDETGRQLNGELVYRKTAEAWVNEGTVEEKWSATQSGLVKAAEGALGHETRQQLDWFRDSAEV